MLAQQLLQPRSIAVIGGSNNVHKPGGKVLKNILDGEFDGDLYVVNPKEREVQGVAAYPSVSELPQVDLAILAIAAEHCPPTVETLAEEKGTRGFIVLSAGFSEESEAGAELERRMVAAVEAVGGSLIGPNCVGLLNRHYNGVFTTPIPGLDPAGCDFISGSGATAVFIMETSIPKGLTFSSVYSVGNSAQVGVEEVLAHLDETFDPKTSSKVKLLYIESVEKPDMLLEHAASLIRKGCRIAAIKAGTSEAGSRAASSHTGALAGSDAAVDALLRKAGIVRCYGREELATVASIFMHPPLAGRNIAVITHAGGPAVMLTDALSEAGMGVPPIEGPEAEALKAQLYAGSAVGNPIDFLATGTAEQLGSIIDACERDFSHIDAMVVIFGSPGLFDVTEVYDVLDKKMRESAKPIYPVLPSVINAASEIDHFLARKRIAFFDEVSFARALGRVAATPEPANPKPVLPSIDTDRIRAVVDGAGDGYLAPEKVQELLDAAGVPRVAERVAAAADGAVAAARELGFPLVMKVVGPVHKSDVGGVTVGVSDEKTVRAETARMLAIADASGVLLQPMKSGIELFAGAIAESGYGHLVFCGLGGVFVEVFKDSAHALAPFDRAEAERMIAGLKGYPLLEGTRGGAGIDIAAYAEVLVRLSALTTAAPEIAEMDLNPLMGTPEEVTVVDARIRIAK
ncbi:MAG: CoA-binding protein [Spirochaetes bacterium]|jgi:acetyltransferase|nr:CoA-binding protein [Spirochaetota bacterium]